MLNIVNTHTKTSHGTPRLCTILMFPCIRQKTNFKPAVTALKRLKQDEHEFKTSVVHTAKGSLSKQNKTKKPLRSARWLIGFRYLVSCLTT